MAAKLTRVTHKIAIQPHLVTESCTICNSRSRRPVRKLLDKPSYAARTAFAMFEVFTAMKIQITVFRGCNTV